MFLCLGRQFGANDFLIKILADGFCRLVGLACLAHRPQRHRHLFMGWEHNLSSALHLSTSKKVDGGEPTGLAETFGPVASLEDTNVRALFERGGGR